MNTSIGITPILVQVSGMRKWRGNFFFSDIQPFFSLGYFFVFHKYVSQGLLGVPGNPEERENGKKKYIAATEFLEKNFLASSPFICGDEITLADLSAYMELGAVQNDDEFKVVYEEYPKVKAWMKRMGEQKWHDGVMEMVIGMIASAQK